MSLIVEDGTGLSTANAYISVDGFLSYHLAMNNTGAASLTIAQIEGSIQYATIWLDARYRWRGNIVENDQSLGMPTENGYDDQGREISGLPTKVSNACAELAYLHSQNALNPILGPRVVQQEVVGVVKRVFSDKNGNESYRYPFVDQMLKGLYIGSGVQFMESMSS